MARATTSMGDNRTGIARSKKQAEDMAKAAQAAKPTTAGNGDAADEIREAYARDADAVGSIPPPAGVQQAGKAVKQKLAGASPTLLVDKLGERLAFERTGVRLYEGLLLKHDVGGGFEGGPTRAELEQIRDEELDHFQRLALVIDELGGDPTAVTPAADLAANAFKGIGDVIADPRTTLAQCLEAILAAELVDNDAWEALQELATSAKVDRLVELAESARSTEAEHLAKVRRWLATARNT